eukprot:TRINITY_DN10174_c0_g1_i1.p1 TRINITY_DN10174_c0_g1~~TRINITY_DN10174_c0_g1_i1.p1  ORF type:complete len:617 (+),score=156.78 TRINITY_DN10174_c0_g1_i1:179-2029(+)
MRTLLTGQEPRFPNQVRLTPSPAALASSGGGGGGVDEDRLARRLRLGASWREEWEAAGAVDVASAQEALVARGRFEANAAQASAAALLARLPAAISEAREARARWDAQQQRQLERAAQKGHRNRDQREKAATWQEGGWMTRAPKAPLEPAVIGPACWLSIGPPPSLKPAGCYLFGSVGSGKTTLMDVFCLFGRGSWRFRRQHFHEFSLWLHQALHAEGGPAAATSSGGGSRRAHVLERVADLAAEGTDIIGLDEFAITNVADAAIFAELLKLLSERGVAVVLTTNRPPEDLYSEGLHRERYLPALVERLRSDFLVAPISGADYREQLFQAEQHAAAEAQEASGPGDAEPAAAAAAVFFEGGCPDEALQAALRDDGVDCSFVPGDVGIAWGRKLPVLSGGIGAGVARFHFDDLCRRALGAEDFLHLALRYHTICVHNVPRLSLEEHNEARRFTNLVDALYEHSVRLICHSEVPLSDVLRSVEALHSASAEDHDPERMGVFDKMYDDSPNFQIQIKELGSRERWKELQDRQMAEEQRAEAARLGRLSAPDAAQGDVGSGWSAAPATADLSAPDQGVAGVMVAAVGSLQESGFAARRAMSRLKEMRTRPYLEAAAARRS